MNKKILVMCEGPNEKAIIDILLDNNKLIFNREDLVDLSVFHARQLSDPQLLFPLQAYSGCFDIYRIGDTQKDELKLKDYKERVGIINKYCTKPELEMLLIISEKLVDNYNKENSKPKDFAKSNIVYKRHHYDNSTKFYEEYYEDVDKLVNALNEYKRIKTHNANEFYLADLLINK